MPRACQASNYLPIVGTWATCSGPWPTPPAARSSTSCAYGTARRCSSCCARLATKHGLGSTRQAISQHLDVLEAAGPGHHPAAGPLQVPPPRHRPARPDRRAVAHRPTGGDVVRINLTSVLVDDQDKALRFYTEVLGFVKKTEVPLGEHRWLTVVSPEDPDGVELVLEPDEHPAVKPVQGGAGRRRHPVHLVRRGRRARRVRAAARARRHVHAGAGEMGPVTTAVLDDTCGNLIQITSM